MSFRYFVISASLIGLAFAATPSGSLAAEAAAQTVHFTNGAVATTYPDCGDTDLCSRITYSDGSVLSIYSEGAAECQPYFLHFVLQDSSGKTEYEFSRAINHTTPKGFSCGHTVATEMVLDHGYIHMRVTETPDGTLDLTFSATDK